jgi:hypothetical protein
MVVQVATVLVVRALRRSGGDGNINLLDGDLKDLTVLGDVLGGDNLALGVVGSLVEEAMTEEDSEYSEAELAWAEAL